MGMNSRLPLRPRTLPTLFTHFCTATHRGARRGMSREAKELQLRRAKPLCPPAGQPPRAAQHTSCAQTLLLPVGPPPGAVAQGTGYSAAAPRGRPPKPVGVRGRGGGPPCIRHGQTAAPPPARHCRGPPAPPAQYPSARPPPAQHVGIAALERRRRQRPAQAPAGRAAPKRRCAGMRLRLAPFTAGLLRWTRAVSAEHGGRCARPCSTQMPSSQHPGE